MVMPAHETPPPADPPSSGPAGSPGALGARAAIEIQPYDFRNPVFLSETGLRKVRMVQEEFARYLSARLSLHLRMDFEVQLERVTTQTYGQFVGQLNAGFHVCMFKAEPLRGQGLVAMTTQLALTIVERLLGGRGENAPVDRMLTEIEVSLLEDVAAPILEEWAKAWRYEPPLRLSITGHEGTPAFLQTSARDAVMLTIALAAKLGDCSAPLLIAVPYDLIEPVIQQFQPGRLAERAAPAAKPRVTAWQNRYDQVQVPAEAQMAPFEFSLRQISELKVGEVIELPAGLLHRSVVLLNGTPKFIGLVGIDEDRVAVQILNRVPSHAN
jgi:flagellar motor switch protein FliM